MKKKENGAASSLKRANYIAAIGASAGGLEALQEFFKAVPLDSGIGFVVIQHLSPDYKSLMDELLARYTKLPIRKATDNMLVEADTVYLIPPRKNLTIFHGKLLLEDQGTRSGLILPIDIFFRSLANDLGKNAIGIILSGTGSDGTLGTRAIKEAGGMVMAQEETTAKFDGMPRSSISTGLVDYILAPGKMPEELVNYIKHPFVGQAKDTGIVLTGDEDSLTKIMMILRDYCGIDFSYYKENTIIRRLERRLSINRFERLDDYLRFLNESGKEKDILYRELLIGVTRFFRDEAAFAIVKESLLPKLIENDKRPIRIWSAGCSTGEEVYSLAMILREYLDGNKMDNEVKIFATDIDKRSLELAGQGFYPESIVSDIDPLLLPKYFIRKDSGYQVNETIRKMVIFATHNVFKDPPFSKLDMIVCRNLFIYLKPDSQSRVLSTFYMALKAGGYLFMGSSETLGSHSEAFNILSAKHKIYYKKPGFNAMPQPQEYSTFSETLSSKESLGKKYFSRKTPKREQINEKIFDLLLPPSVLLDDQMTVIQVINDINPYIQVKSGKFNQNLTNMVSPEIAAIISNIYRRVKKPGDRIVFENVLFKRNSSTVKINIEGWMLQQDDDGILFLVSFREIPAEVAETKQSGVVDYESQYHERVVELQNELQFAKENLQATVEELETSNEELQASNEELIASNEELQSTNEELQSVNEELYTVNSEYQSKIEELTQLNNDISNLLNNTEIGALYLDRKLCIRKFTSTFSKIGNILDLDIGRPIHHIATSHLYAEFLHDIYTVQENLQPIEKEVSTQNGMLYLARIVPYRTDYQAVDGILVTMVNISNLKKERTDLLKTTQRLQSALEMGNMAWWEWDVTTGNVQMHEKKATMLGYTLEEFPKNVYEICKLIHPDDFERTMQNMRDHLEGRTLIYEVAYRILKKDGGYKWYYDKGGIVERDKNRKPLKVIGLVLDLSESKLMEERFHIR